MARDIVINDFSGGMTGEQGQFAAKDNTYVKDIQNGIVNRGGTISPRPGIEELDINLLPHDKMLPFRFKGKDYFLVYDTLLKRRWTDVPAEFTALRTLTDGTNFGYHDMYRFSSNQRSGISSQLEFISRYHGTAMSSIIRFDHPSDPTDLDTYFTASTEAAAEIAFNDALPSVGIDYAHDSFFWQRMVIFDDQGMPVCYGVKRVFYMDEDSGHEQLTPMDSLASLFTVNANSSLNFNSTGEDLEVLRMAHWGGSDITYDAAVSHDYVIFTSPSGKLPPLVWRPTESWFLEDLRTVYHPQLSSLYVCPSYLTVDERAKLGLTFQKERELFTFRVRGTTSDLDGTNSPFTYKPNALNVVAEAKVDKFFAALGFQQEEKLVTRQGMELVLTKEWGGLDKDTNPSFNPLSIQKSHENEDTGVNTLRLLFKGKYTIVPVFYSHYAVFTKRENPPASSYAATNYSTEVRDTGVEYVSWRLFPHSGRSKINRLRVPSETQVVNRRGGTSNSVRESFPLALSLQEPLIEGNYILAHWSDGRSVEAGASGYTFRTHSINYFDGEPFSDQALTDFKNSSSLNPSGVIPPFHFQMNDAGKEYRVVISAPTGPDIVIPNGKWDSYEATIIRTKASFGGDLAYILPAAKGVLDSPPVVLALGANKGKYFKHSQAVFGKTVLAGSYGHANEFVFTQSDPKKPALDFSTLDLLIAPLSTPPTSTKLLGAREVMTKESGIYIQWLAFINNELRIGTSRGLFSLVDLYPGASTDGKFNTTLHYPYRPTATNGNEYFLAANQREVFYLRQSREYQSTRQYNVSFPLFTDVLASHKVVVLQGLTTSSLLLVVANQTLYLGSVDDTKKDEEIAWSRMKFTKGDVGEMRVVGEHIYMGLGNNEGKSIVRFTPTGNTPWGKEKVVSAVEFLNTWVYLLQERNRDATLDLATTPEATTATNVKIIAHIGEKDLAVLDENDGVSAIIKSVKGQIPFIDTGGALGHTQGLRIKLTNQEDVLEMVSFLVSNS